MSNRGLALRAELNAPYEQAVDKVVTALKAEGFGVLTEIDVQATLKKKLDRIGKEMSLNITCQDENIFKAMHRV